MRAGSGSNSMAASRAPVTARPTLLDANGDPHRHQLRVRHEGGVLTITATRISPSRAT
jgi:hypothetical protein